MTASIGFRQRQPRSSSRYHSLVWVRRGIWLYLFLLIFEGALRKWIVPHQLNGLVALARDPVAVFIYWSAYRSQRFTGREFSILAALSLLIAVVGALQVALEIASPTVVLYGLRSYALHLPLIFVMRQTLSWDDLKKIGRFFMIVSIPMALLMVAQFTAGPASWLNAGVGEGSTQLDGALGHLRAAGTFSFVTGTYEFFPIVQAFVISEFLNNKTRSKLLLSCAAFATLAAIPLSVSRTLFFNSMIVAAAAIVAASRNARMLARLTKLLIVLAVAGALFLQIAVLNESLSVFQVRWDTAKGDQQTSAMVADRLVYPEVEALADLQNSSLLGQGIGLGSNFASFQQNGSAGFLLSENAFIRVLEEFGAVGGIVFLSYKICLAARLFYSSFQSMNRSSLPLLLTATTGIEILMSNMEQPTSLGFMVFGAGLALAGTSRSIRNLPLPRLRPNAQRLLWNIRQSPAGVARAEIR